MPSYLNVPAGSVHLATASTSTTLVNGTSYNAEPSGAFSFAELEGNDFNEQVQISPMAEPYTASAQSLFRR